MISPNHKEEFPDKVNIVQKQVYKLALLFMLFSQLYSYFP